MAVRSVAGDVCDAVSLSPARIPWTASRNIDSRDMPSY